MLKKQMEMMNMIMEKNVIKRHLKNYVNQYILNKYVGIYQAVIPVAGNSPIIAGLIPSKPNES